MKKILIFGGTGQVGTHLIRLLTKNNYRVTVVTRNIHKKGHKMKIMGNAGYINLVEANISPIDFLVKVVIPLKADKKINFSQIFSLMFNLYRISSPEFLAISQKLTKILFSISDIRPTKKEASFPL